MIVLDGVRAEYVDGNSLKQVKRYPGNKYRSFYSLGEAQEWIKPPSLLQNPSHLIQTALIAPITAPDLVDSPITTATNKPSSSQAGTSPTPITGEPEIILSPEQIHVLNLVKSGKNVFFTGSAGRFRSDARGKYSLTSNVAGTGKSVLLRQIIGWARRGEDTDAAVTASTGMAAVNISGVTLHSWAGIGLGNGKLEEYVKSIVNGSRHWKKVRERWRDVKTLIIDESNLVFYYGSDSRANEMGEQYL